MNDTNKQDKLNPSGFKESITQTDVILIDVCKMIVQNPPSVVASIPGTV